ncbi:MAG: hypothetical protein K2J90_10260 [Lachnospiraceae bacterium]|nr:hypothetical protein [Lachnospiraceae bacterium]
MLLNEEANIIRGMLCVDTPVCKTVFDVGKLVTEQKVYNAYPVKDKNVKKILYQYIDVSEVEFLCELRGDNVIVITGVKDDTFSLCLGKARKAEREMKECEAEAAKEFAQIFDKDTEFKSSFNGMISVHVLGNVDLEHRAFSAFDEGRDSFKECINQIRHNNDKAALFFNGSALEKYVWNFLSRNFYWQYKARITPKTNIGEVHMGQNGSSFGIENVKSLYISPRLRAERLGEEETWGNYSALNRRVSFKPFSIGHLLKTGFVIHDGNLNPRERLIHVTDVKEFYSYFDSELTYSERLFVEKFLEFTDSLKDKPLEYEAIPLLLPQYRYRGLEIRHKYRADFLIIDSYVPMRSAFIEVDDPGHMKQYDIDTEKRNELEAAFHFQHYTIRPKDDVAEFFEDKMKPLLV